MAIAAEVACLAYRKLYPHGLGPNAEWFMNFFNAGDVVERERMEAKVEEIHHIDKDRREFLIDSAKGLQVRSVNRLALALGEAP